MSAFIVSKTHVDLIVTAAVLARVRFTVGDDIAPQDRAKLDKAGALRPTPWPVNPYITATADYTTADAVGAILWRENDRSVCARYKGDENSAQADGYRFKMQTPPKAVEVLKAINCLEYQSCEHDGWKNSTAKALLERIFSEWVARLPGYDSAAWSVNDKAEAIAA